MANTLADDVITEAVWVDAYAVSGITVGIALLIQNKGKVPMVVVLSATAPASATDTNGIMVTPIGDHTPNSIAVSSGEAGCWIRAINPLGTIVNIQNNT